MPRKKNAVPKVESEIAFIEPPAPDKDSIPEMKSFGITTTKCTTAEKGNYQMLVT